MKNWHDLLQRPEEDNTSLYSWVSESDWESDYEEFTENQEEEDEEEEEEKEERDLSPAIPSKACPFSYIFFCRIYSPLGLIQVDSWRRSC